MLKYDLTEVCIQDQIQEPQKQFLRQQDAKDAIKSLGTYFLFPVKHKN